MYDDPEREQAFKSGEGRYLSDRPCEECGNRYRAVYDDGCVECGQASAEEADRRFAAEQEAEAKAQERKDDEEWRNSTAGRVIRFVWFIVFASAFPNEKQAAKREERTKTILGWPYGVRVLTKVSGLIVIAAVTLVQIAASIGGAWAGVILAEGSVPRAIAYGALGLPVGFIAANWVLLLTLTPLGWLIWHFCRLLAFVFADEAAAARSAEQGRMQDELSRIRQELARLKPRRPD